MWPDAMHSLLKRSRNDPADSSWRLFTNAQGLGMVSHLAGDKQKEGRTPTPCIGGSSYEHISLKVCVIMLLMIERII